MRWPFAKVGNSYRVPLGWHVLRVGLTGGIASGKSTVARAFGEMGAHVLDADASRAIS